jgi:leader peptidase (prepilin peptidase)/N-methyltransferase
MIGFLAGILVNGLADALPYYRQPRLPFYPPDGERRPPLAWSGLLAFLTGQRESAQPAPPPDMVTDLEAHPPTREPLPVEVENADERAELPSPPRPRRLSWRHPIVEIVMAMAFGFLVLNWPGHERIPVWMLYISILALITIIDLEHFLILVPVIVPACLIAIFLAFVFPEADRETSDYLLGGAIGLVFFLIMFWGGGIFSGFVAAARGEALEEVAFGFGDVMLATLCGLMIGWQAFIFAMLITVFAGAAGAIIYLIGRMFSHNSYDLFTPLPYGPYIVLGTIIMMLWRDDIRQLLGG